MEVIYIKEKININETKPQVIPITQFNGTEYIIETCRNANKIDLIYINKTDGTANPLNNDFEIDNKRPVPKNFNMPISTHFASGTEDYGSDKELFNDARRFIHDRVELTPEDELISTIFVFLTYIKEVLSNTPYIHVLGQYGTGKTTYFKTVGSLCYDPITATGNSTIASIERIIHELKGTLLLDECDWNRFESKPWYALLRSGYDRTQPYIKNVQVGKHWIPHEFDVFGVKILVSYERFYDNALNSRCFEIVMSKKDRKDLISVETPDFMDSPEVLKRRNKLLLWKAKNLDRIKEQYDHSLFNDLDVSERVKQVMRPLGNIVKICMGADSPEFKELISVLHKLNDRELQRKSDGLEAKILLAIKNLLGNETISASSIKNSDTEFEKIKPQSLGMKMQSFGFDAWKGHGNKGSYYTIDHGFKEHLKMLLKKHGIDTEATE